jgi:transcriptional regulator with XRE-family HTH domain
MDVMINSELLKSLRLKRSWSQEKLANASGLSLRTIQRAESTGTASLETRLVLSTVLGIKPDDLERESNNNQSPSKGAAFGFAGAGIGLLCSYAAITFSVLQGNLSLGNAGVWYGVIGACAGVTCAIIGTLNQRAHVA